MIRPLERAFDEAAGRQRPACSRCGDSQIPGDSVVLLQGNDELSKCAECSRFRGPDGQLLVLVSQGPNNTPLQFRTLDDPTLRPIAETEGAMVPFFSPDGNWLGFFSGGVELRKTLLPGGASDSVISSIGRDLEVQTGIAAGDLGARVYAYRLSFLSSITALC